MTISQKFKRKLTQLAANGVPIFVIKDPKTKMPSVSLTLVFISFNVWLASVIGKISGHLGGMNTNDCLNMFLSAAALYFGRKFQQSDSGKSSLGKEE